jgi:hypothetical protein
MSHSRYDARVSKGMTQSTTPRFKKRTLQLEVVGLLPLQAKMDDWERALLELALARLLDSSAEPVTRLREVAHADEL